MSKTLNLPSHCQFPIPKNQKVKLTACPLPEVGALVRKAGSNTVELRLFESSEPSQRSKSSIRDYEIPLNESYA